MHRRRWILLAAAVVPGMLVLALLLPGRAVSGIAMKAVTRETRHCLTVRGAGLDTGRWPAGPRLLTGRLHDVTFTADTLVVGTLHLRDVRLKARSVTYSALRALTGQPTVSIHDAAVDARVDPDGLETFLRQSVPYAGVRLGDNRLWLRLRLPLVELIEVPVSAVLHGDRLVLEVARREALPVPLPRLELAPPAGLRLDDVEVAPAGLTVRATIDYRGRLRTFACATADAVRSK